MNFEKPIKEGDLIDVTIESTGAKGDGIAKIDNFVIIVPDVQEGDQVKVKITRVLKKMAFAEKVDGESEEAPTEETAEETEETPAEEPAEETTEEPKEEVAEE